MSTIEKFRGRMITPAVAAKTLGNSEATIHRWIMAGKVAAVRLGRRMTRVDGDSLADFLQASKVEPGKVAPLPASLARAKARQATAAPAAI